MCDSLIPGCQVEYQKTRFRSLCALCVLFVCYLYATGVLSGPCSFPWLLHPRVSARGSSFDKIWQISDRYPSRIQKLNGIPSKAGDQRTRYPVAKERVLRRHFRCARNIPRERYASRNSQWHRNAQLPVPNSCSTLRGYRVRGMASAMCLPCLEHSVKRYLSNWFFGLIEPY